jgi:hypothetical protein
VFTPKYPRPDTAPISTSTPTTTCPATPYYSAQVPAPSVSARRSVQLNPGSALTLIAGGSAAVLVIGAVLVSMLLAVAITAASVAVCAVVVRSILKSDRR